MKNSPFIYATLFSLIGTAVYILVNYFSTQQIDWTLTLIIFVTIWIAIFIRNKLIKKRK